MATHRSATPRRDEGWRPDPRSVVELAVRAAGREFNLRRRVVAALDGLRAIGQLAALDDDDKRSVVMAYQLSSLEARLPQLDEARSSHQEGPHR